MAKVHRLSVYGPKRFVKPQRLENLQGFLEGRFEYGDCFEVENDFNAAVTELVNLKNCSKNVVDYVQRREHGAFNARPTSIKKAYGTRHLIKHHLLREFQIPLNSVNKVFSAKWLSDSQIVLGTKCNKLLVLDLITKKCIKIPCLKGSPRSPGPDQSKGIYSIQMNPSQTLLATGARNANDVAIYQLPTLEPVCVGEGAHEDRIFDIIWLDDQFFISGSRDSKLALWRVDENILCANELKESPSHAIMTSIVSKDCERAQKVRALSFNQKHHEFVALSLNAYLHTWDLVTFKQKSSVKLPHCFENVCLALRSDCSVYAVGSKSNLTLHDSRTLSTVESVPTRLHGCSIRSLSFDNSLITMGLGNGLIMFYDCRAGKYLECHSSLMSQHKYSYVDIINRAVRHFPVVLEASSGWVYPNEFSRQVQTDYNPAILTLCYDPSGTRLFTAGGPLTSNLFGNYASLWQ